VNLLLGNHLWPRFSFLHKCRYWP